MGYIIPFSLVLVVVLSPACSFYDRENNEIEYGKQFSLNYNSSAKFEDGSRLVFADLLSESRCPDGALCAWEGEAKILVSVEPTDTIRIQAEMTIRGFATASSSTGHDTLMVDSFAIILLQLDPYPQIDQTEPKQHYRAIFSARKI
jgi:hypothetical protein